MVLTVGWIDEGYSSYTITQEVQGETRNGLEESKRFCPPRNELLDQGISLLSNADRFQEIDINRGWISE